MRRGRRRSATGTLIAAAIWVVAGYDWASNAGSLVNAPASAFGCDLGGHVFFRVAGPLYLGGAVDYSLAGPNALLAALGVRVALEDVALSAGVGYTSVREGGLGALVAFDVGLSSASSLRVQGSWRRSSFTGLRDPGPVPVSISTTVWSLMGGLAFHP